MFVLARSILDQLSVLSFCDISIVEVLHEVVECGWVDMWKLELLSSGLFEAIVEEFVEEWVSAPECLMHGEACLLRSDFDSHELLEVCIKVVSSAQYAIKEATYMFSLSTLTQGNASFGFFWSSV